ncbi:MAG: hypothetical protein AAF368_14260, partial [Planctomycetota bacterium]
DRVVDLVILLDHLLAALPGEAGGELPGTTRERVDRHRELFDAPYPEARAVHAAITIRNRIVHSGGEDPDPTTAEAQNAASTLQGAVRAALTKTDDSLRAEVEGGKSYAWLMALVWFLGVWQLLFFATSFLLREGTAAGFVTMIVVALGIVPLHVFFFPAASRFVSGTRNLFRVMAWSALGFLFPIARVLLDIFPARSARKAMEPVFEGVGAAFELAARGLGDGLWAFAPWAIPLREETWDRMEGRSYLPFTAIALLVFAVVFWRSLARGPMKRCERVEAGAYPKVAWVLTGLAGAFLIAERILFAIT